MRTVFVVDKMIWRVAVCCRSAVWSVGRNGHGAVFLWAVLVFSIHRQRQSQTACAATPEYVVGPATGQMILRNSAGQDTAAGDLNETLYVITDPQGNITAITNDAGSVVERYIYDPTGNVQALTRPSHFGAE